MPMPKGRSGNPNGRPKGVPNKTTTEFKQALNDLLEHAAPQMVGWLQRVADENPEKALDTVSKYIEFIHPKLARTEVKADVEANVTHNISENDKQILERYGIKS